MTVSTVSLHDGDISVCEDGSRDAPALLQWPPSDEQLRGLASSLLAFTAIHAAPAA